MFVLTTRGGKPIADCNERPDQYTTNRRFFFELVGTISPNRNSGKVIYFPYFDLNILRTEKILRSWDKKFSTWHVIPALNEI